MPAWVGPAIMAGGSLLGGLFGRRRPPVDPNARFYGMAAESAYGHGQRLIDNPYGLGSETKRAMRSIGRDTLTSGLRSAQRGREASFAQSGLSQAGGSKARMDYYAGQQLGEGLQRTYNQVELLDQQAREQQRARGENMLMSLANKNPIYSQISSQNYWNSIQDQGQFNQGIANSAGAWYQNYLQEQNPQQPYPDMNPFDYNWRFQNQQGGGYLNPYDVPGMNPIGPGNTVTPSSPIGQST